MMESRMVAIHKRTWFNALDPILRPAIVNATELNDQHTDVRSPAVSPSPCIIRKMIAEERVGEASRRDAVTVAPHFSAGEIGVNICVPEGRLIARCFQASLRDANRSRHLHPPLKWRATISRPSGTPCRLKPAVH